MLDLHCHLLPGIDDGARDLETALEMARMAVADGITLVACTPHIYPGMYDNDANGIGEAITAFRVELANRDIPLALVRGADVHMVPGLPEAIREGRVPTIAGSRYLLLEPPHHVAPPRFRESIFDLMVTGCIPVITHPERLTWIEDHYALFVDVVHAGAWLQLTAGSLTGRFGRRCRYWSERLLDEGLVHVIATDAHDPRRRPPLLAEGYAAARDRVGVEHATHMVFTRPQGIVDDRTPGELPPLPAAAARDAGQGGLWRWLRRS
jgi:protein-tyrosine phosphatase